MSIHEKLTMLFNSNIKAFEPFFKYSDDGIMQSFISTSISTIIKDEDLRNCSQLSLLNSVLFCAKIGLVPCKITGHVYLSTKIVNGNSLECYPIVGYKGQLKLAYRSGAITSASAGVIFNGAIFSYSVGIDPFLKITDVGRKYKDSDIDLFYSFITLSNGERLLEVKPLEEIIELRDNNEDYKQKKDKSYYGMHFRTMGQRDTLKAVLKYVSIGEDFAKINTIEADGKIDISELLELDITDDLKDEINKQLDSELISKKVEEKKVVRRKKVDNTVNALNDMIKKSKI